MVTIPDQPLRLMSKYEDFSTHAWPLTVEEAIAIQQLRGEIITSDQLEPVQYVAGVDVL